MWLRATKGKFLSKGLRFVFGSVVSAHKVMPWKNNKNLVRSIVRETLSALPDE